MTKDVKYRNGEYIPSMTKDIEYLGSRYIISIVIDGLYTPPR